MKKGIVGISLFIFCLLFSVGLNAQTGDRAPGTGESNSATQIVKQNLKIIDRIAQNGITARITIDRPTKTPKTFTPLTDRREAIQKIRRGEGIKYVRPTRDGSKYNGN